jgi:nicotinamidase-related amidase
MPVDQWRNPALVVVDMQNDFVRVGAPMEVPDARETIPQQRRLIAFGRQAGMPIVYTRYLATPQRSLIWEWSPQLEAPVLACKPGHQRYYADVDRRLECIDIIDELYPQAGEHIVDKYGYGAFHNTILADLLRALGVEALIITGTVTQICVEETGREAFHHGYKATLVSDAVSSYMPDLQAATLKNFALKFGWVCTTEQVLAALAERFKA